MSNELLVVGGSGFIGENVVREAISQGYNVTVVSKKRLSPDVRKHNIKYVSVDIANQDEVRLRLGSSAFNYVINLAGYVDHSDFFDGGEAVIGAHYGGTLNLIKCLNKKTLIKYVHMGSSDEYGNNASPQNEEQRESPISPYSYAKTAATQFLQMLHRTECFPAVIIRPFLVYGPGQDINRFIPQVIKGCISNDVFPVSSGEQLRDFCYIADFVDAIFLALKSKRASGHVINIASGQPVMIRTVIEKIVLQIGQGAPSFGAVKYRQGENMKLYADTTKARTILGWEPKVDLDSGIRETIKWVRSRD